jgi:hypothetical protein
MSALGQQKFNFILRRQKKGPGDGEQPGPKQPRFWGHLGDAVSMVFGPAFPSPHLKKTNDCKNHWSELNGLNFGTLSGV